MGRQAYLAKIALGRSAFEPAQTTSSTSEYAQLASAQQERAHEHGRRLRVAQNDVLASIGVVKRHRSPGQGLPGSYEEEVRVLEHEDTLGNILAISSTLSGNVCTWWVGSLRERILTFNYPNTLPFSRIVASERTLSGQPLLYSGFSSRFLSHALIQAVVYGTHMLRPVDRLLVKHGSTRAKQLHRQWRSVLDAGFRVALELLFFPFSYHSYLQRLGLVSARPLLPPLESFIPFSSNSPLLPFSFHHTALASPTDFLAALVTCPFVFICLEHFYERWVLAVTHEPIEATIIHPSNPTMLNPDDIHKHQTTTILGLRKQPPKFVRDVIAKLLGFIGWGDVSSSTEAQPIPITPQRLGLRNGDTIEVGETHVSNINRLEVPGIPRVLPTTPEVEMITVPTSAWSEVLSSPTPTSSPPSSPPSPTASQASLNDNDPRIRITNREGIVEMEVRLPPHVLLSHTEIAESGPPTPNQRDSTSPDVARLPDKRPFHRVTQLSSEPSQLIGSIFKAQILNWVTVPLKLVTLRLVASHHLAGHEDHASSHSVFNALVFPGPLNWESVGVQLWRLALCGLLELAIDLTLWGFQYRTVTWMGTRFFDWGAL